MREIKFRTWDKYLKRFFYFTLEEIYAQGMISRYDLPSYGDSKTSQQFTGFKDKNGKEAFVKDIYKDKAGNIGIIEWDYPLLARLQEIEFEIIGNVFENKDLLTKK